ncbi:TMEM175 family protein [Flavobacterium sp. FZUC8N2.13]|uniref:TMEM175 family protein n=1 Tax=Flavobacterium zubiriense TaxID=3138075 RepID=UPI00358E080F
MNQFPTDAICSIVLVLLILQLELPLKKKDAAQWQILFFQQFRQLYHYHNQFRVVL